MLYYKASYIDITEQSLYKNTAGHLMTIFGILSTFDTIYYVIITIKHSSHPQTSYH